MAFTMQGSTRIRNADDNPFLGGPGNFRMLCLRCLKESDGRHKQLIGLVDAPGGELSSVRIGQRAGGRVRAGGRPWAPNPKTPNVTTTERVAVWYVAVGTGELVDGVEVKCGRSRGHSVMVSVETLTDAIEQARTFGTGRDIYL